jgi:elongator complex protein 2
MMLWRPDANTGVWMNEIRVGDIGGLSYGFYGCAAYTKTTQDGSSRLVEKLILSHGYKGAIHLWKSVTEGVYNDDGDRE